MSSRKKSRSKNSHKGTTHSQTGVAAKKHLGQHFLTDTGVAHKIANTLQNPDIHNVLEIGPGTGVLTRYLLEKPVEIIAVELDRESVRYLREVFPLEVQEQKHPKARLEILEADFLSLDLSGLFKGREFAITGNFPYNISTQIVFRLLEYRDRVPEFSGMFQKEVAERICSQGGNKVYGILSVLTQAYYRAEYLFTVPPDVFDPPPKVESGVIRLTRKDEVNPDWDEKLLFKVVKAAFNQRRKTLRNSLKSLQLSDNLREDTIFERRPEQLTVSDFIALTKKIQDDTL